MRNRIRVALSVAGVLLVACQSTDLPTTQSTGMSRSQRGGSSGSAQLASTQGRGFQKDFNLDRCSYSSTGKNPYMILEPGWTLILRGDDDGERVLLRIEVLNETLVVDGVETRIVKETEWKNGELYEIALNYFALCEPHNSVIYFGEDVDFYENGQIIGHDGTWRAGVNGNQPGLIRQGLPVVGSRYFQEVAPGVALDQAEVVDVNAMIRTLAGTFQDVLVTDETTPLEPELLEFKAYALDIGLIQDNELKLIQYGFNLP